jgi:hypothetical protein
MKDDKQFAEDQHGTAVPNGHAKAVEVKSLIQESTELTKILFTIIANACKARR